MSFKSSWRSLAVCIVLAPFTASCSFLFVQPLKTNDNVRAAPLKCTTSNVAPGLDTVIAGWQVVRIMLAAGASEADYAGTGSSQGADITLGILFGALAVGSAIYGFNATDECRRAGGGLERRHTGRRNTQEERDEEAAAQARAATLANMAAQQAQAAGVAAHKASEAAGRADAGTPQ
jgi:hypothetical protein